MAEQPGTTPTDDAVTDSEPDTTNGTGAGSGSATGGAGASSAEKDPADWVTGDEPATGPQESYLGTLAREAGEDVPEDLTKAQASELIDDLQSRTGRGQ